MGSLIGVIVKNGLLNHGYVLHYITLTKQCNDRDIISIWVLIKLGVTIIILVTQHISYYGVVNVIMTLEFETNFKNITNARISNFESQINILKLLFKLI